MGKILILLIAIFASSCETSFNQKPAEYIKELVAYKEGSDGIFIYFILADALGKMTANDGEISLRITASHYDHKQPIKLWEVNHNISKDQFKRGEAGIGPFKREILAYSFGRIPYDRFRYHMGRVISDNWRGKITLQFKTAHKVFTAEETIHF